MQAFFVLANALNRAGSADSAKLQTALRATAMPHSAMIVGYRSVRFDDTGHNVGSATYLTQLQGQANVTIRPEVTVPAKVEWPNDRLALSLFRR